MGAGGPWEQGVRAGLGGRVRGTGLGKGLDGDGNRDEVGVGGIGSGGLERAGGRAWERVGMGIGDRLGGRVSQ